MNSAKVFKSEKPCIRCKCGEVAIVPGIYPGGHYAKVVCAGCDRFVKWQSKPVEKKDPRKRANKNLVADLGHGFCEMCRRTKEALPLPQVLEAHHVIQVAEGGTDDHGNIWIICTHCHRLIHLQRTYFSHYQSSHLDLSGLIDAMESINRNPAPETRKQQIRLFAAEKSIDSSQLQHLFSLFSSTQQEPSVEEYF